MFISVLRMALLVFFFFFAESKLILASLTRSICCNSKLGNRANWKNTEVHRSIIKEEVAVGVNPCSCLTGDLDRKHLSKPFRIGAIKRNDGVNVLDDGFELSATNIESRLVFGVGGLVIAVRDVGDTV